MTRTRIRSTTIQAQTPAPTHHRYTSLPRSPTRHRFRLAGSRLARTSRPTSGGFSSLGGRGVRQHKPRPTRRVDSATTQRAASCSLDVHAPRLLPRGSGTQARHMQALVASMVTTAVAVVVELVVRELLDALRTRRAAAIPV